MAEHIEGIVQSYTTLIVEAPWLHGVSRKKRLPNTLRIKGGMDKYGAYMELTWSVDGANPKEKCAIEVFR